MHEPFYIYVRVRVRVEVSPTHTIEHFNTLPITYTNPNPKDNPDPKHYLTLTQDKLIVISLATVLKLSFPSGLYPAGIDTKWNAGGGQVI